MNKRLTMKTSVTGTGLLAALALANGCGQSPVQPGAPGDRGAAGRHLYVGLDSSGSWRPYLGVSATLCARQALRLDPDHDHLTLYRMDSSTQEFSDGPAPESGDRLQRTIVSEVQGLSATDGTFPAHFWTTVADRADADTGPVVIETFSDGDNDDQTAQSETAIKKAAQRLAKNPQVVSVSVFGAEPRNWATLRREFTPLGDRFHLCSPSEMTADRVASALGEGQ